MVSTDENYLSVLAYGLPNVAPAKVDVVDDSTPHGCGVGGVLIVLVAAGDAAIEVCYTIVGRIGLVTLSHKDSLKVLTIVLKVVPVACPSTYDKLGASVVTVVEPVKNGALTNGAN